MMHSEFRGGGFYHTHKVLNPEAVKNKRPTPILKQDEFYHTDCAELTSQMIFN